VRARRARSDGARRVAAAASRTLPRSALASGLTDRRSQAAAAMMSAGESRDALAAVRMAAPSGDARRRSFYSYHRIAEGPGARAPHRRAVISHGAWPSMAGPDGEQLLATIIEGPVTSERRSRRHANLEFVLRPLPDRDDDAARLPGRDEELRLTWGIKSIYVLMIDYHLTPEGPGLLDGERMGYFHGSRWFGGGG